MRALPLAFALLIAGCADAPARSLDGEPCEAVFGPLFDPAGPSTPVEHARVDLGALDAPAGCRVLEDEEAVRAALEGEDGDAAEVDPASERLVTLRASRETECFSLGQVYRLPSGSIVVETFTGFPNEGAACARVWGVALPRDGAKVVHAHDED